MTGDTATERQHWTPAEKAMIEAFRDLLYTNDRLEERVAAASRERNRATDACSAATRAQSEHQSKVIAVERALEALGIDVDQVRADLREQRDRA